MVGTVVAAGARLDGIAIAAPVADMAMILTMIPTMTMGAITMAGLRL